MKKAILPLIILFAAYSFLSFGIKEKQQLSSFTIVELKKKNLIRCSPDWNEIKGLLEEADIPPIPGAGIYKWKITTKNDSAQFYFNQGINMYYSFHIIEAQASFQKAARFDPNAAIIYWAQALTYGPNINDYGYRASPAALEALNKAKEFTSSASNFEQALIDAMAVRYTADSADATRAQLNQDYTDMMKRIYEKFAANADAQALYADAMMLQHPWDLWKTDGTPKEWTPHIREVLEKLLVKHPDHPGANHYYIHVMEPSPFAAKALPSAERLGKTNPGLSHVVHMPSHIYLRTGRYQKGVDVNTNAVNSYKKVAPLYSPVTSADFLYVIHNLHMKTNNAMLMGNYKISEAAALETRNSIPADYLTWPGAAGNYVQYIYMTPVLVNIRFGKWDKLLQEKQPVASHVYANLLYRFGRGMAYANTKKFDEANQELEILRSLLSDPVLLEPFTPFSAAVNGGTVASKLLSGTIALKQNITSTAIIDYSEAAYVEQEMVYNEPRDWLLNTYPYLGAAYLADNDWYNAEKHFKADLQQNNENGWSLYGLYQCYVKAKKTAEAAKAMARHKTAFTKADVKISSAVY